MFFEQRFREVTAPPRPGFARRRDFAQAHPGVATFGAEVEVADEVAGLPVADGARAETVDRDVFGSPDRDEAQVEPPAAAEVRRYPVAGHRPAAEAEGRARILPDHPRREVVAVVLGEVQ